MSGSLHIVGVVFFVVLRKGCNLAAVFTPCPGGEHQTICFWRARTCTTRKDVAQMSNVSPFTVHKTLHTASYGIITASYVVDWMVDVLGYDS